MAKNIVYTLPRTGETEAERVKIIALDSFRKPARIKNFAALGNLSYAAAATLLTDKALDDAPLPELLKMRHANIKRKHPIESYPSTMDAIANIDSALKFGKNIGIYGDYDGDGVTSALIMYEALLNYTDEAHLFVDFSLVGDDGFGFSSRGLDYLATECCCEVILVLDTGTSSTDTLTTAVQMGIEVIVIDHHPPMEANPLVDGICYVNPHMNTDTTPCPEELRNAGLAWYFSRALHESLADNVPESHFDYPLAIAALGTIADAGSQFNGRFSAALLTHGLTPEKLRLVPGLGLLWGKNAEAMQLDMSDKDIATGFRKISLAKRIASMSPYILFEILSLHTDEPSRAAAFQAVEDRYSIFEEKVDIAVAQMMEEYGGEEIYIGIAPEEVLPPMYIGASGTLASKLAYRFQRPCITFVRSDDGSLQGSWRSGRSNLDGIDMMTYITKQHPDLVAGWGGHVPAGGVALASNEQYVLFRSLAKEYVSAQIKKDRDFLPSAKKKYEDDGSKKVFVTCEVKADDISEELAKETLVFGPFSRYNVRPPSFYVRGLVVAEYDKKEATFIKPDGNEITVRLPRGRWNSIPDVGTCVDVVVAIAPKSEHTYQLDYVADSRYRVEEGW